MPQLVRELVLVVVVREQVLDSLEPGLCGSIEPVEKVDLVEHHR